MEIEYDPLKRYRTLQERKLDMADASEVFEGKHLTFPDVRQDYRENRFVTFGNIAGRLVCIAWTPRRDKVRIISMRKANAREEKRYAPLLGGRTGRGSAGLFH